MDSLKIATALSQYWLVNDNALTVVVDEDTARVAKAMFLKETMIDMSS